MTTYLNAPSRSKPTISIAWMYVLAGVVTLFLSVATIVAIAIARPQMDILPFSALIFASSAAVFSGIAGAIKSQAVDHKVTEVGYRVDGKMRQLIEQAERRARLEGRVEGVSAATGTPAAAIVPGVPSEPAAASTDERP